MGIPFKLIEPFATVLGMGAYFILKLFVSTTALEKNIKPTPRLEPLSQADNKTPKALDDATPQALGLDCEMVGVGRGGSEQGVERDVMCVCVCVSVCVCVWGGGWRER